MHGDSFAARFDGANTDIWLGKNVRVYNEHKP
jgi:hypothetical protein